MPRSRICQFYNVVNFPKLAIESWLHGCVTQRAWSFVITICASWSEAVISLNKSEKSFLSSASLSNSYLCGSELRLCDAHGDAWACPDWARSPMSPEACVYSAQVCSEPLCHSQHCSPSLQISGWIGCNTGVKMGKGDLIQCWWKIRQDAGTLV